MTEEEKKMITRQKHSGRGAQGHKRAALNEKSKEEILHSNLQNSSQYSLQYSLQYSSQYSLHYSLQYGQMILMSMVLVCLLSLRLAFIYFLHITILKVKTKKPPMKKNKINHQNDVICFKKHIING